MTNRLTVLTTIAFATCAIVADADIVFTASGTGTGGAPISASAVFASDMHDFGNGNESAIRITLANTGDPIIVRGNLLTSIFWSFTDINPVLDTTSAGFDGLAATVVTTTGGSTTSNVDLGPAENNTSTEGTFQLSNGPFGISNSGGDFSAYDYGISTVGMGLTGFNGSDVNGDNYGIATAGTNFNFDGLPSALPLIDQSAVFWIRTPDGFNDWSQIARRVAFGFGSLPDNTLTVPEPGSFLVLLGTAGAVMALVRRRRSTGPAGSSRSGPQAPGA